MLFRFDPFDTPEAFDRRPSVLAMDAVRTDDSVFVYFDAPGMEIDDVDLTVERDELTIEASRRWADPSTHTLTSERPQGVFRRRVQLSDNLDTDAVIASLDKGVLTVEIPMKEHTKPRSVEISAAGSRLASVTASSSS